MMTVQTLESPVAGARASRRQRLRRRPLIVITAMVLIGSGYAAFSAVEARKPIRWSGTIEARTIELGSRQGGRVKEVLAAEGDAITPRQVLVRLEEGELVGQRGVAEGELAQAEAELQRARQGARPEEIDEARANVKAAQAALTEVRRGARRETIRAVAARVRAAAAALKNARRQHERTERLASSGAVPRAELDSAASEMEIADAAYAARREELNELRNGSRPEQIQRAAARVDEARARADLVQAGARAEEIKAREGALQAARGRLSIIEAKIEELTIRAPMPGRVEALDLRPGDLLAPNATAATVLEDKEIFLRLYIPETQLGLVHVGSRVSFTVDTFGSDAFAGVVESISGVGEFSPRNLQTVDERANQVFPARVKIIDGRDRLRAGMAAMVEQPR